MIKLKSKVAYWESFKVYQTFGSVKDMNSSIKRFKSAYALTGAVESVLETIKLHAKNYIGVCWLYREQIAIKAKVSLSSVDRAIHELKETGLLTVHNMIHTKRGGKTHNVYVLNPIETPFSVSNESSLEVEKEPSTPCVPTVSTEPVKLHKNLNNNLIPKDTTIKNVPSEFIKIMEPYYSDRSIISDRFKSVCVAVKKTCRHFSNTSWDEIESLWKLVVNRYKRNKIKNNTDDGIGAYFYSVLLGQLPLII